MTEKAEEVMISNYAFMANRWFEKTVKHCDQCDHDECTLYYCFRDFLKEHGYENVKISDLMKFVSSK
ncbi:MAG: hypothetical protein HeimC3_40920 [Candidatus Heimdallarchaeota archaeon LC_3]|nr:MAG: hypothetical protein HeimC3_40920 [Candidatus Heimdallarchaeota archaeon LC_3]